MNERKLPLIIVLFLPIFLFSQDLVVEKYDKVFEVIISDPSLIDLPYGVSFRNTTNGYLTKISDGAILVANDTCCLQGGPIDYDYAALDFHSLSFTSESISKGSWSLREPGSSFYDLQTFGNITSNSGNVTSFNGDIISFGGDMEVKNFSNLPMVEIYSNGPGTVNPEQGYVKLYKYSQGGSTSAILSVDGIMALSDRRLKHDIKPIAKLLPKVLQLRPSTYIYNGFKKASQGFIAQEVQKIFPDLVGEIDGHLAVNYTAFSTIAIQAIKEQQETIESLSDQVQSLESRLIALEKAK